MHSNHTRHYREQPLPGRGRGNWRRAQPAVCHLVVADPGGPDRVAESVVEHTVAYSVPSHGTSNVSKQIRSLASMLIYQGF